MSSRLTPIVLVVMLSMVGVGLFLFATFVWYVEGGPIVAAQDDTVGEMLLDEGLRLEAAGAVEAMREKYVLAASARFEGTKNLRHLQSRLGMLGIEAGGQSPEYWLGQAVQDLALLEKSPKAWFECWTRYVESLDDAEKKAAVERLRLMYEGGTAMEKYLMQRGWWESGGSGDGMLGGVMVGDVVAD